MWDGDAGPNQISEGLEYQTAELELYPVSGEPQNDILKVGLNDQICTWKALTAMQSAGVKGARMEAGSHVTSEIIQVQDAET